MLRSMIFVSVSKAFSIIPNRGPFFGIAAIAARCAIRIGKGDCQSDSLHNFRVAARADLKSWNFCFWRSVRRSSPEVFLSVQ
jgi:hypothetical protein